MYSCPGGDDGHGLDIAVSIHVPYFRSEAQSLERHTRRFACHDELLYSMRPPAVYNRYFDNSRRLFCRWTLERISLTRLALHDVSTC